MEYVVRTAQKTDAPQLNELFNPRKAINPSHANLKPYLAQLANGARNIHVSVATARETPEKIVGVLFFPYDAGQKSHFGTGLLVETAHRGKNVSKALALHGLNALFLKGGTSFRVPAKTSRGQGFWKTILEVKRTKGKLFGLEEIGSAEKLGNFISKNGNIRFEF